MGRVIRLWGIGAFLAVVLLLALFGFVWADKLVKDSLEAAGTEVVGARVELEHAAVSFFDQAVELRGLAVTNPDEPMSNLLEAEHVRFDVDLQPLLWRRVHIDSMVIAGLRLNTPREQSGAIDGRRVEKLVSGGLRDLLPAQALPSFSVPSPEEAIKNERLETLAAIDALERDVANKIQHIEDGVERLPTAEDIEQYRARLKALKSKNYDPLALLAKSDEIKSLRGAFKSDVARVKALRKEIAATKTYIRRQIEEVKTLPRADIERIRKKYSLSGDWVEGLTAQIFGREIAGWGDKGWRWFNMLRPYLSKVARLGNDEVPPPPARGEGVNIRFPETDPAPDVLIRQVLLSAGEAGEPGYVRGEARHVNNRPGAWPHPMTFDIEGEQVGAVGAFQLQGSIDRREADSRDRVILQLQDLGVRDLVLSGDDAFPVTIGSGDVDVSAELNTQAEQVDLSVDVGVAALDMQAQSASAANRAAEALLQAIAALDSASFHIGAKGDIREPDVSIKSDLDRVLSDVLKRELARETDAFMKKIEGEVLKNTENRFAPLNRHLAGLDTILSRVNDKGKVMDGLLDRL